MEKKYFPGFTLVELMIVIAIISILAALIVAVFTGQIFKGNDAKRKGDIDRIKIAAEEYEKDHNCYPSADDMKNCGTDSTIAIHPYLNNVPCDPVTNKPYVYETNGTTCPVWFRIYTVLQNIQDSSVVANIGPGGAYNYVGSSDNAPNIISGSPIPTQTPVNTGVSCGSYGCKNGVCIPVNMNSNGVCECQPVYDSRNCYGQCGASNNPASQCIIKN